MYIKWMDTCTNTRVLTACCCARSSEEGVMEDIKGEKYVILKNKNTDCCCADSGESVMEDVKKQMHT